MRFPAGSIQFPPHLSVGAVVVVLVRVFQLDRIAEFQDSLLQTNAHILGILVHGGCNLGDGDIASSEGRQFDINFLFHVNDTRSRVCELLVRILIISHPRLLVNTEYEKIIRITTLQFAQPRVTIQTR